MIEIIETISPIFLLIVIGSIMGWRGFPTSDFWSGVDRLVYWFLFPVMLFLKISEVNVSSNHMNEYIFLLLGMLVIIASFIMLVNYIYDISSGLKSSILQSSVRFNTFIVFAISGVFFDDIGLEYAALGIAILIPVVNIFLIVYMTFLNAKKGSILYVILKEIFKNPLVISILLGFIFNIFSFEKGVVISSLLTMLTQATLPLVLLSVGAALKLGDIKKYWRSTLFASVVRMVLSPILMIFLCYIFDIYGVAAIILVVFSAVPTATSGYMLAKKMGGNAEAMAVSITFQTASSLFTLPIVLFFAKKIFI